MIDPVHMGLLGQHMQIFEWSHHILITGSYIGTVRDMQLIQISLFEGFPSDKLDTTAGGLLDDDMVLVAPGYGQVH